MFHVLSAGQFNKEQLGIIFDRAESIRGLDETDREALAKRHLGKRVATLFYEPSTRTRMSFETAAQMQGMAVVSTENATEFSSAMKGETIEDTIRTAGCYVDAIVIRHRENGAAERAAAVSEVPIMNAGDGTNEHPTQALLDLYTIQREKGRLDNLRVVIGGDLKHGRTVRSLAHMLCLYDNNHISFVSVPELQIDDKLKDTLEGSGTDYNMTDDMQSALGDADVVYWTRLQKERLEDPTVESSYIIDSSAMDVMSENAILMHPLPRVHEISKEVDADPRAAYFRQAKNGLYIRAALLDMALSN